MKLERHNRIMELINENAIDTQEELASLLGKEGYNVTQATISRDIKSLGLVKIADKDGNMRYGLKNDEIDMKFNHRYERVLKEALLNISVASNLLIIKTVSGMAMGVAAALDALRVAGIIGSIAGDDTIFCACESEESSNMVKEKIYELLD